MERYYEIFRRLLNMNSEEDIKNAKMNETKSWTSFVHLKLIAQIEQMFDITFDAADILEFNSFESGLKILERKGIQL